jgi:hypothetical protein
MSARVTRELLEMLGGYRLRRTAKRKLYHVCLKGVYLRRDTLCGQALIVAGEDGIVGDRMCQYCHDELYKEKGTKKPDKFTAKAAVKRWILERPDVPFTARGAAGAICCSPDTAKQAISELRASGYKVELTRAGANSMYTYVKE